MLVADVTILFQSLVDDPFEFDWEVGIQAHRRYGVSFKNGVEDDSRTFPSERQCPGRHLVKYRTEGEQIRACVQFLSTDLFRRHIGNGSNSRTWTGQVVS